MAPLFEVQFQYIKTNKPIFKIHAFRIDRIEDLYEIDIQGHKNIKTVMKRFNNEYMMIVDNLRIMGDALVLLNPIKNHQLNQNLQVLEDSISQPTLKS